MKKIGLIIMLTLLLGFVPLQAKTWTASELPMVHLTDARRYVCDPENIMNAALRDSTDRVLQKLDKECGIESVFVIVGSVKDGDTFRFAQDIGNRQGVGNKKTNRGLVIVVAVNDHSYFVAPGEGLEGDLTDVESDDIGRQCIAANMKKNNPSEAMLSSAKAVYSKFKTGKTGLMETEEDDDSIEVWFIVIFVSILIGWALWASRGKHGGDKGGGSDSSSGGPFIFTDTDNDSSSIFDSDDVSGGSFGGGSFGGGGAGGSW